MCDRRRSLCDIASQIGISFGAVPSILTNFLGMSKASARLVPRMFTKDQKKRRRHVSKYLLSLYEDDPEEFMHRVVTIDETWIHHLDPETNNRVCNGSTLAQPILRNLREFLQQGR